MRFMSDVCYNYDMINKQLITSQNYASVQEAQSGISRLFKKAEQKQKFYTVLRNQEPLGVLIPQPLWEELVEDLEALMSNKYQQQIAQSRQDKIRVSAQEVKQELNFSDKDGEEEERNEV